jgi:hypothetical protein
VGDTVVIVHYSEDGDIPSVEQMSKDEFKKRLKENYYGERPDFVKPEARIDGGSQGNSILVIEGRMILPKPVQVVTEFDL